MVKGLKEKSKEDPGCLLTSTMRALLVIATRESTKNAWREPHFSSIAPSLLPSRLLVALRALNVEATLQCSNISTSDVSRLSATATNLPPPPFFSPSLYSQPPLHCHPLILSLKPLHMKIVGEKRT